MVPSVSVIVPVYNAEQTIEKCVESLALGQVRDLEIILVDDGSRDGSPALCRMLADQFPHVRCLFTGENRGVSHARNLGLKEARGEFVLFVDSDDWVSAHYARVLLDTAREKPESLTLCGLHFLNMAEDYRRTYLWEASGETYVVEKSDFFELHRKFLLPQLWNKIFRRNVVEDHHLRFDENLTMGEDFQFVLDYLEAAGIETCLVCNRPLYYYTRRNHHTLMQDFGLTQRESEFARYAKLRDLSGSENQYIQALDRLKGSFVYHTLRHRRESRADQLARIRQFLPEEEAQRYYRQLQITKAKEFPVLMLRTAKQKLAKTWGDYCRARNRRIIQKMCRKLGKIEIPVTILSQNCIGGVLSKDMGLRFESPTVGLFIKSKDFVRFLSGLDAYLAQPLEMRWGEEYPIGTLGDIEIHFMHYETCRLAREAWLRRCERINPARIVAVCTDRDGFVEEDFGRWTALPWRKVLFTARKSFRNHPDSVYFREFRKQRSVGDLITHRKFYRRGVLISRIQKANEE